MFKKFFLPSSNQIESSNSTQSIDLVEKYNSLVEEKDFQSDAEQLNVVEHLQLLIEHVLNHDKYQQLSFADKLFAKGSLDDCNHLYIFGGVGRGKSMLMDLFFETCPIKLKRRVHFHAFMQEVHDFIHGWEQCHQGDVINALAKQIRTTSLLLCFDEFHVTDIADAMVMERLFRCLFERGIIIVMTSNRHPSDLYQGGLLREQFLAFVDLLLESSGVVELPGDNDYRSGMDQAEEKRYHYPLNVAAEGFIDAAFKRYSCCSSYKPGNVYVYGRKVALTGVHEDVLLTSFSELCHQALGAADYLKIASKFNIVIMSGIPRLAPEKRDEARRFETLIDAIYEHRVIFICSAEAIPEEIYLEGDGSFEFKRTVSRLKEMQSEGYRKTIFTSL